MHSQQVASELRRFWVLTRVQHVPQAMKSLVKPKAGPDVIKRRNRQLVGQLDYDVVVCGGTLGLLLALSLQASRAQADSGWSCLTV